MDISPTAYGYEETHDDPDGADRGGIHREEHSLSVENNVLTCTLEVSDYFEDRMGYVPEPLATNKGEALTLLASLRRTLLQNLADIDTLITSVAATESFVLEVPESEEESSEDEEDEEDDEEDDTDYESC